MWFIVVLQVVIACGRGEQSSSPTEHSTSGSTADVQLSRADRFKARFARINALGRSCKGSDWAQLALIAAQRFAWNDQVAPLQLGDARLEWDEQLESFQCRSMEKLHHVFRLAPPRENVGVRRRFAAAFAEPEVLVAIEDLLTNRVSLPQRCRSWSQSAGDIIQFVPLHQLRRTIEGHAPEALKYLDRDRVYRSGERALRIEEWAAELTPEGFIRVLDTLDPDYQWNDGAPPPTAGEAREIRQRAEDMLYWLDLLVAGPPAHDCETALQDAVANGELGAKIVGYLDHPGAIIRHQLTLILVEIARPGTRERLEELAQKDPDSKVRAAAAGAVRWFEAGGYSRETTRQRDDERAKQQQERSRRGVPPLDDH